MRAILVILLVVLVLLLGLPMAMTMAGSFCPDCQSHGPPCPLGICPVILVAFALLAPSLAASFRLAPSRMRLFLLPPSLDRPPRSA
ncbi:MAG TPA: hypothetical protein VNO34_07355 [Actinomycetota bacterium]|nr:hypothetical protein [Actinomycetota bacterium]